MSTPKESPQAVFERITRRRNRLEAEIEATLSPPAPAVSPVVPSTPWPTQTGTAPSPSGSPPGSGEPVQLHEILTPGPLPRHDTDTFPRSATMRFILNNPTLALGVGVPAAALLLKSHATRRVLRLALEVGTRPDVQNLIGLSTATVRLMQSREGSPVPPAAGASSSGSAQKKAP